MSPIPPPLESALEAWQRAYQAGHDRPPADFCRDHPDLLPELERRAAAVRHGIRRTQPTADATPTVSRDQAEQPADDTRPTDSGRGHLTATVDPSSFSMVTPPGFVLDRELGRGGMGVVYLAHQHGLNRPVALKVVLGTANSSSVIRFLAEAETVAAVRHPNVVEVYQFGEHDGQPFLALEYCPGGDLTGTTKAGPADPRRAAELLAAVAEGWTRPTRRGSFTVT